MARHVEIHIDAEDVDSDVKNITPKRKTVAMRGTAVTRANQVLLPHK